MTPSAKFGPEPISPTTDQGLCCLACNYDLRGLSSERCPECGLPIARDPNVRSTIPWTYRNDIGWFRAYRQTVWLTIRHPQKLAANVALPANLRDALRFRSITALIAFVPVLILGLWQYISGLRSDWQWLDTTWTHSAVFAWSMEWIFAVAVAACFWLFLFCMPTVATFLVPKTLVTETRNRAIALSYYGCVPLLGVPLLAMLTTGIFMLAAAQLEFSWASTLVQCALSGASFLIIGGLWITCPRLIWYATGCTPARFAAMLAYLPIAWLALAILILVVLPCVLFGVLIVVFSLR